MKSLAEGLPADIADRIAPEWRRNESTYWTQRASLLSRYQGQWIGFAEGEVIAAGTSPVQVLHTAVELCPHPYVTCVGHEEEPCQMRRAAFSYSTAYHGEPLPVVTAEFRRHGNSAGVTMDNVIPDTGADATALPWSDCERLRLDPVDAMPGLMGGVGGSAASTIVFRVWVVLDGRSYPCRLQADFRGDERLLGREVLNRLDVLFQGPGRKVILSPGADDLARIIVGVPV